MTNHDSSIHDQEKSAALPRGKGERSKVSTLFLTK